MNTEITTLTEQIEAVKAKQLEAKARLDRSEWTFEYDGADVSRYDVDKRLRPYLEVEPSRRAALRSALQVIEENQLSDLWIGYGAGVFAKAFDADGELCAWGVGLFEARKILEVERARADAENEELKAELRGLRSELRKALKMAA